MRNFKNWIHSQKFKTCIFTSANWKLNLCFHFHLNPDFCIFNITHILEYYFLPIFTAVKTTTSNFSFKSNNSASSDATWVCVFCNLSANVPGMAGEATGDLFGPYFIRMPDQINSEESRIHSWRTSHPEQAMKKVRFRNQLLGNFLQGCAI